MNNTSGIVFRGHKSGISNWSVHGQTTYPALSYLIVFQLDFTYLQHVLGGYDPGD